MKTSSKFVRRLYQNTALVAARKTRVMYLFWTRRGRKSTTLGDMAFDAMSSEPGTDVIAASASLLVGSELISMAVNSTEQAMRVTQEAAALRTALENAAASHGGVQLQLANAETGKSYKGMTSEDYVDLYRSKRLEYRLYFDKTRCSRMLVIAPNPATARGWGGWVFRDEQQFTSPEMERELQIATNPIIDTDPTFRLIYASNLCGDDRHPGYEMTLPREPAELLPNPAGHFYISQTGILVHRVNLADAYAAGHTLFDKKTGAPVALDTALQGMSPSERKQNYMLIHEASGTACVDALALHTAQSRGVGRCASIYVDSDLDFERALAHLRKNLAPGVACGIGVDVATTEKGTSNPSSVTVTQGIGAEYCAVLNVIWKTRDPKIARERMRRIVETCRECRAPARQLCIDGSNEYYFAVETQQEFAVLVPVRIIKNGENVLPPPPGYDHAVNYKTLLGDLYTAEINDNHYALPPENYFKKDHRSVLKDRGTYEAEADADGGHGDTFDSGKLAQFALTHGTDEFHYSRVEIDRRSFSRGRGVLL